MGDAGQVEPEPVRPRDGGARRPAAGGEQAFAALQPGPELHRVMGFAAEQSFQAIAVVPVVLFHAGVSVFSGGYVGVDIFFVLSGFLLYRPFVRAHLAGTRGPAVGRYLKRRFLRIFPAYWLVLLCVLFVLHQTGAPVSTADGEYCWMIG